MDVLWISIGAALAIVGSAFATAWAQSRIGAAAAALAEKPELRSTAVLRVAIPETRVILGFVIAVLIVLKGG